MLVSEFLNFLDFDPSEKFIVHFDDLEITDCSFFGYLSKYADNKVVSFSKNSDGTFVLILRCS